MQFLRLFSCICRTQVVETETVSSKSNQPAVACYNNDKGHLSANAASLPVRKGKVCDDNEKVFKEENSNCEEDFTMPGVEVLNCPKRIMRDLAEPVFDVWTLDRDSMVDHIE